MTRIRQILAQMLESREIDPPAGFVQLQIGRLSEAMIVARTMMMEGDLHAMDRWNRADGRTRPLSWLRQAAVFASRGRLAATAPGRASTRIAGAGFGAAGSDEETFPGCKLLKSHETGLESADWSSPLRSSRGGVQEQLRPRPPHP